MNLKMTTFLPEDGEEIMYTSCSEVPYEIELSDPENFMIINRSSKFFFFYKSKTLSLFSIASYI
jgi:hypothetical protein